MEDVYANVGHTKYDDRYQTGSLSSERRFHGAAVRCLGLLNIFLLFGLIGLGVHYHKTAHGAAAELYTIKVNLSELLHDSENKVSSLTEERDQLNVRLSSLTAERDQLNVRLSSLTAERDQLNVCLIKTTDELNRLQKETCPAGWTVFSGSCYLLSTKSGSWTTGREDCHSEGTDLVVVDSTEEQRFLSEFSEKDAWVGLSDTDKEGTWTWIDGTPLSLKNWEQQEPNNGGINGNEDCVQIRAQKGVWNDLHCGASLHWICEKKHKIGECFGIVHTV